MRLTDNGLTRPRKSGYSWIGKSARPPPRLSGHLKGCMKLAGTPYPGPGPAKKRKIGQEDRDAESPIRPEELHAKEFFTVDRTWWGCVVYGCIKGCQRGDNVAERHGNNARGRQHGRQWNAFSCWPRGRAEYPQTKGQKKIQSKNTRAAGDFGWVCSPARREDPRTHQPH